MNSLDILIISDNDNRKYWEALSLPVRIVLDKDLPNEKIGQEYEVILVDISVINDLFQAIKYIHANQPRSDIIVVHATPTWKFTRQVLELGAAKLVRKDSPPDEILKELISTDRQNKLQL